MKKPEELLKTAEPAQQNLPSAAVLGGSAATTLSGGAFSANSTAHPHFSLPASITASSVAAAANAAPAPELSHVSPDARLSALERTHELVSLHAVRLSNASTDTMRVVIEPGAGLNLSLELRWHKDGIDVQASLHRGDYEHLSRHWSELQQRLEPRGIHLGTLECPNASVSDHSSYQQSARQAADREPAPSALAEFTSAVTNTTTSASRSVVSTHRGWETWA